MPQISNDPFGRIPVTIGGAQLTPDRSDLAVSSGWYQEPTLAIMGRRALQVREQSLDVTLTLRFSGAEARHLVDAIMRINPEAQLTDARTGRKFSFDG